MGSVQRCMSIQELQDQMKGISQLQDQMKAISKLQVEMKGISQLQDEMKGISQLQDQMKGISQSMKDEITCEYKAFVGAFYESCVKRNEADSIVSSQQMDSIVEIVKNVSEKSV